MSTTTNPNDCGNVSDTDSLWVRIHQEVNDCEKDNKCHNIYPKEGYALKEKSPNLLMVATDRITGIECPKLWENKTPHYWELAWKVAKRLPTAAQDRIGMAINAKYDHNTPPKPIRKYDQLHIHVSCIHTDVQKLLETNDHQITTTPGKWKDSTLTIRGNLYRVLRLDSVNDLAQKNLFELLRAMVGNDPDMQYQTLVMATRPQGGFYILNSQSNMPHGTGAGERNLLNESCS
jgi:CDP-diacylglycerol pyrophosphatase